MTKMRGGLLLTFLLANAVLFGSVGDWAARAQVEQDGGGGEAKLLAPDIDTLPRLPIGGWVSVPGSPFPFPLPKRSVEDAIPIVEKIVAVLRRFPGSDPTSDALRVGYLAGLHASLGRHDKAEGLYREALEILRNQSGAQRSLAWLHNNQGMNRWKARSIAEAAKSFRAAVAAIEGDRDKGPGESRAIALQNLATTYHLLGDFEASESAYLRALDLLREMGEVRSRTYQDTSNNLALLYGATGACESGQKILEDLLERGGIEDPSTRYLIVNDLGSMLRCLERLNEAEARFLEALSLAGKGQGRGAVLSNLGVTHYQMGKRDQARRELEEALGILEPGVDPGSSSNFPIRATLGTLAFYSGDFRRAEELLRSTKASLVKGGLRNRFMMAEVDQGLALVAQRLGQHKKAVELGRQALDLKVAGLDQILAFASEAQRLAYQRTVANYDHLAELGDALLLAEAVLRFKGAILDSLLAERAFAGRSASPENRERIDRIHALRVEAMEAMARGDAASRDRADGLARSLKQEETALAKSAALPLRKERSRFDLERLQGALEPDQVLVELVRFHAYEKGGRLAPHYGAVVLSRWGPPVWTPLGPAKRLEDSIDRLVNSLDGWGRGATPDRPANPDSAEATLRDFFDRLWQPLATKFPEGTRKVVISPDGALHFVPWVALVDRQGVFLGERWRVSHVGSGRDLLRPASVAEERSILALADGTGDLSYAREEARHLAQVAREQGWRATVLTGDQASEPELFARASPGILHLATHGGQLEGGLSSAVEKRLSRLPMYRGFVLLGGAARSLEAWGRGTVPPVSADGILTAEEVAGLDLSRTWLTVLSACQTGIGESRSGEGVLGLRRGFTLAGTQNLLFTLWSVDDRAAAQFMERFYERLFATRDLSLAFHETQLARLRQLKASHGIRRAVAQAGGFVLSR